MKWIFVSWLSSPPLCAFLPPWISALDDTPKPSAQWRSVLAAVSDYPSSDQILVGEPLSRNAHHEAFQPLQRVALHIALIEPECELINVAAEMLWADVMERAVDAALQHRPNALDAVCRHAVVADVFASAVIDGFTLEKRPHNAIIC